MVRRVDNTPDATRHTTVPAALRFGSHLDGAKSAAATSIMHDDPAARLDQYIQQFEDRFGAVPIAQELELDQRSELQPLRQRQQQTPPYNEPSSLREERRRYTPTRSKAKLNSAVASALEEFRSGLVLDAVRRPGMPSKLSTSTDVHHRRATSAAASELENTGVAEKLNHVGRVQLAAGKKGGATSVIRSDSSTSVSSSSSTGSIEQMSRHSLSSTTDSNNSTASSSSSGGSSSSSSGSRRNAVAARPASRSGQRSASTPAVAQSRERRSASHSSRHAQRGSEPVQLRHLRKQRSLAKALWSFETAGEHESVFNGVSADRRRTVVELLHQNDGVAAKLGGESTASPALQQSGMCVEEAMARSATASKPHPRNSSLSAAPSVAGPGGPGGASQFMSRVQAGHVPAESGISCLSSQKSFESAASISLLAVTPCGGALQAQVPCLPRDVPKERVPRARPRRPESPPAAFREPPRVGICEDGAPSLLRLPHKPSSLDLGRSASCGSRHFWSSFHDSNASGQSSRPSRPDPGLHRPVEAATTARGMSTASAADAMTRDAVVSSLSSIIAPQSTLQDIRQSSPPRTRKSSPKQQSDTRTSNAVLLQAPLVDSRPAVLHEQHVFVDSRAVALQEIHALPSQSGLRREPHHLISQQNAGLVKDVTITNSSTRSVETTAMTTTPSASNAEIETSKQLSELTKLLLDVRAGMDDLRNDVEARFAAVQVGSAAFPGAQFVVEDPTLSALPASPTFGNYDSAEDESGDMRLAMPSLDVMRPDAKDASASSANGTRSVRFSTQPDADANAEIIRAGTSTMPEPDCLDGFSCSTILRESAAVAEGPDGQSLQSFDAVHEDKCEPAPVEPCIVDTSSTDDVSATEYRAYAKALARSLSKGRDAVRQTILRFLEHASTAANPEGRPVVFATDDAASWEQILVDVQVQRKGDMYQVSYRCRLQMVSSQQHSADKDPAARPVDGHLTNTFDASAAPLKADVGARVPTSSLQQELVLEANEEDRQLEREANEEDRQLERELSQRLRSSVSTGLQHLQRLSTLSSAA